MQPFLSIIIPTLNSANTLENTLDSILKQRFTDIEVLIIDGLSSDNTLDIAKKYQSNFSKFKIFSESDKGIYEAMNKAIPIASGKWIYFMGADDTFYDKDTLTHFKATRNLKKFDVIYGNVFSPRFGGLYDGEFNYSKLAIKNICHQAIFFNKKVFEKIGLFNLKYKAHADWDHNLRWFFSSKISWKYIDTVIANYADGGFSSVNGDEVFERDKIYKILWFGPGKLPTTQLLASCNIAIDQARWHKENYRKAFLNILKIRLKLFKLFKF